MSKKTVSLCQVLANVPLSGDVCKMTLLAPEICQAAKPGQFVNVKAGRADSPLLRRPISVADVEGERLTLIYRTVGEGSKWLASCAQGQMVDLLGPLGRGFAPEGQKPILAGGGIGLAPLLYLARAFAGKQTPAAILLAGRNKSEILFWQELFAGLCAKAYVTTDDGSMGVKGHALMLLPQAVREGGYDYAYACGPSPMLKAVAGFVKEERLPCQLSLESRMGCGLGLCLACACSGKEGKRQRICLNGPVFAAGEVEGL
jgi:dihydroorotate dehydrogenase electron transfer subunit